MDKLFELLLAVPEPLRIPIISSITTIAAAVLAATVIFIQIGRQSKNAIRQTRINEAIKLKKEIYGEVIEVADELRKVELEIFGYTHKFEIGLTTAKASLQYFSVATPPRVTADEFSEMHYNVAKKVVDFIALIERWTIVDPRLIVFQLAINSIKFDLDERFQSYLSIASRTMPNRFQLSANQTMDGTEWEIPSNDLLNEIKVESTKYRDALMRIGSLIFDFNVAMQNLLLGELFSDQLPHRMPIDPNIKVVKLDDHDSLTNYFNNETAWGRSKRQAIQRAKDELAKKEG